MAVIDNVKTMIGLSGDSSAELTNKLTLIISGASNQLLSYLPKTVEAVPQELEYIVMELAIARYNRISNEGMSSYSQEGESFSFNTSDISPYLRDIEAWCSKQAIKSYGVVRFI